MVGGKISLHKRTKIIISLQNADNKIYRKTVVRKFIKVLDRAHLRIMSTSKLLLFLFSIGLIKMDVLKSLLSTYFRLVFNDIYNCSHSEIILFSTLDLSQFLNNIHFTFLLLKAILQTFLLAGFLSR